MKRLRPSEAIFADGRKARSLALHPDAVNVSYPTIEAECVADIVDGVAVLCVDGPLEHRMTWWSNYEALAIQFKALCDDSSVRAIVMKFDSPGGECAGLNETVALMQAMKSKSGKSVTGYVDEACYSAAYALAMVCDEIFLPESGGVGSIGVITAMADITERDKKDGIRVEVIASGSKKTDGHPHVALTDGAIKRTRKSVDKLASAFFDIVSAGRGLPVETIAGFQAGIFMGQDAVDCGLADGVMSLQECLQLAGNLFSSNNQSASKAEKESPMNGPIAAAKALKDAEKALAAAKTDADRALAAARVLVAEANMAKVKKTKTVTTDTHEEETDDGEPDEDDGEEEESASEDGDEEEAAAASLPLTKTGKAASVLDLARKITGKKAIDEVCGALQGMADSYKKTSKLAAEVAQLKADAEAGKVSALIVSGLRAGKLAPSQKAWAKTQSPASLKAYLDAAPKMVHTDDDEHTEARVNGAGPGAVTAEMAKIWRKQGFTEAQFPALLEKLNASKTTNGAS